MVRNCYWVMFTTAVRCWKLNFAASHGTLTSFPPLSTIRYSTCPASSKTMSSTVPMLTFPWMFTLVPSTCLARYAVVDPGTLLGVAPGWAGAAGGGVSGLLNVTSGAVAAVVNTPDVLIAPPIATPLVAAVPNATGEVAAEPTGTPKVVAVPNTPGALIAVPIGMPKVPAVLKVTG